MLRHSQLFRVLAFLVAACACFEVMPTAAQTKLKVAEGSRSFTVMPLYIALSKGYFRDVGLDVDLVTLRGGPAAANALLSGDVDVAFSLVETPIKVRAQGKALRVAALVQDRNPIVLVVPANSAVKTLADLKGKTIGVTATGSLTDLVIRAYIRREGLNESDFKIIGMGSGATVSAALERGSIDAASTFTPFLNKLVMGKTAKVMFDFRKETYAGQAALIRDSDLAGAKEPVLRRFIGALMKAGKTLYEDRATVARVAREYFPEMDQQLLEAMIHSDTVEAPVFSRDMKLSRADFDALVAFLLTNKLIAKPEKYEDIVASQLWQ